MTLPSAKPQYETAASRKGGSVTRPYGKALGFTRSYPVTIYIIYYRRK